MVFVTANHFRIFAAKLRIRPDHFQSTFGLSPEHCSIIWNLLDLDELSDNDARCVRPDHLLWALMLLKVYATENVLAGIAGVHRQTFRKWSWLIIKAIAKQRKALVSADSYTLLLCSDFELTSTLPTQIRWANRLMRDRGRTCRVTIDCLDCRLLEPIPFSKRWYTKKFNGPGFRYEVAVCIQTGWIVWINGPFRCGEMPDITIFRRDLKQMLAPGEMVECDGGYRGDDSCRNKFIYLSENDRKAKSEARARHETVNGDIKKFQCLNQRWRHDRDLHKWAFVACAVLVQLTYSHGNPPYHVYC